MESASCSGALVMMQPEKRLIKELRCLASAILSARPGAEDTARVPHLLYGHVPAREAYSVGRFIAEAAAAIGSVRGAGRRPILVGGTGLYFKALLEGLAPIPPVPDAVRARWRAEAEAVGAAGLHALLGARDPVMARRLAPTDTQRLTRALEVLDATGRSLADWQLDRGTPVLRGSETVRLVVHPGREAVRQRCDERLAIMFAGGAVDEVRRLAGQGLDPALPSMRALGVRPLLRHLAGDLDEATALALAQAETRQFVKRQDTWLRSHMIAWKQVGAQQMESQVSQVMPLIEYPD